MQDFSIITNNIETIKKMAAQGDADAQNKIGICYKLGLSDFLISDKEAAKWFQKAAEQGHAKGTLNKFTKLLPDDQDKLVEINIAK